MHIQDILRFSARTQRADRAQGWRCIERPSLRSIPAMGTEDAAQSAQGARGAGSRRLLHRKYFSRGFSPRRERQNGVGVGMDVCAKTRWRWFGAVWFWFRRRWVPTGRRQLASPSENYERNRSCLRELVWLLNRRNCWPTDSVMKH